MLKQSEAFTINLKNLSKTCNILSELYFERLMSELFDEYRHLLRDKERAYLEFLIQTKEDESAKELMEQGHHFLGQGGTFFEKLGSKIKYQVKQKLKGATEEI